MMSCNVLLAISSIGIKTYTIGSERFHPPELYSGKVWMFLRKYFYRHHSAITSLTEQTAIWLKNNTNAKKVVAINNCIQLPLENLLPKLHIPDCYKKKRKLLLSVGRIEFQKGFDLLIDAFKIIEYKPRFSNRDLSMIVTHQSPPSLALPFLMDTNRNAQ